MRPRDEFHPAYLAIRPKILDRDGHRCRKCCNQGRLEVHHIHGYRDNRSQSLVTLCSFCHNIAPMGEEFFEWMQDGQDGVEHSTNFVFEKVRAQYSGLTDDQFNVLVRALVAKFIPEAQA